MVDPVNNAKSSNTSFDIAEIYQQFVSWMTFDLLILEAKRLCSPLYVLNLGMPYIYFKHSY